MSMFISAGVIAALVYKLCGSPEHKHWLQVGLTTLAWSWLVMNFNLLPS